MWRAPLNRDYVVLYCFPPQTPGLTKFTRRPQSAYPQLCGFYRHCPEGYPPVTQWMVYDPAIKL